MRIGIANILHAESTPEMVHYDIVIAAEVREPIADKFGYAKVLAIPATSSIVHIHKGVRLFLGAANSKVVSKAKSTEGEFLVIVTNGALTIPHERRLLLKLIKDRQAVWVDASQDAGTLITVEGGEGHLKPPGRTPRRWK